VDEKQADGERMAIRLEYRFDRLLAEKLAQAYELLVPNDAGWLITPIPVGRRS
jgi:hypothetical protein